MSLHELGSEFIIAPCGLDALTITSTMPLTTELQLRLIGTSKKLKTKRPIRDVIVGLGNVTIFKQSYEISDIQLVRIFRTCYRDCDVRTDARKIVNLPIRYATTGESDLPNIANTLGITIDEIIKRHCERLYTVMMLGAQPGHPYLFKVNPSIQVPRRSTPRHRVKIGSVVIAGPFSGILTCNSASGWNIVGACDVPLFDVAWRSPAMLRPGDMVRFSPIVVE